MASTWPDPSWCSINVQAHAKRVIHRAESPFGDPQATVCQCKHTAARLFRCGAIRQPVACGTRSVEEEVLITVGRWMSDAEFRKMTTSSRVVESAVGGVTSVIFPASSFGYKAAPVGDEYYEFEIDDSRVNTGSPPPPWGKIYGPTSLVGIFYGVTDMPPAFNLRKVP
jgi:hypothetical protein